MSRHENQNKKRKKWRHVYRKFDITQRFNIEDTKERSQIRVMEVKKLHKERHYEGSHILFIESRAQCCIYRFVLAFLPFIVDLRFGKILNIASYMRRVTVGKSV